MGNKTDYMREFFDPEKAIQILEEAADCLDGSSYLALITLRGCYFSSDLPISQDRKAAIKDKYFEIAPQIGNTQELYDDFEKMKRMQEDCIIV